MAVYASSALLGRLALIVAAFRLARPCFPRRAWWSPQKRSNSCRWNAARWLGDRFPSAPPASAAQSWTATASTGDPNDPWLELGAAAGATPGTLTVGLVNWRGEQRKPGKYQGSDRDQGRARPPSLSRWNGRFAPQSPPPLSAISPAPMDVTRPMATPTRRSAPRSPLPDLASALVPGASYVDPNFGAKVRVMTGNPVFHTYSTPSPLSAHNKYLMTYPENGTWDILDVATGRFILRRAPLQPELLLGCRR